VYVSEADQIDTVLAELAAADSSESILQAMVRINEISESDDGTLEDPMTREVRLLFKDASTTHDVLVCVS
jgi:hypothetical protein